MSPSEIYGLCVPASLPFLQEESSGKSSESGILFLSASYLLLESHQYEGQQYPLGFAYAASVPGDPRETETPGCYMDAF